MPNGRCSCGHQQADHRHSGIGQCSKCNCAVFEISRTKLVIEKTVDELFEGLDVVRRISENSEDQAWSLAQIAIIQTKANLLLFEELRKIRLSIEEYMDRPNRPVEVKSVKLTEKEMEDTLKSWKSIINSEKLAEDSKNYTEF